MGKRKRNKKKYRKSKILGTRLVELNWDEVCDMDLRRGRGFEVTQPATDSHNNKNMYGIQSPLFCSDWSDDNAFEERYICSPTCHNPMKGKVFEGEVCPECKNIVEFRDVDMSMTGWIRLHNNYVIQPIFYNKLSSIIGKDKFNEIIKFDKVIDKNGILQSKESPDNPYIGIGLIEFKERFDEILTYYKRKKKNKLEEIHDIEKHRDKVFTSCIPVYSSVLRPSTFREESFFYSTIDKKYNSIFSSARLLNDNELFEKRRKKYTKKKRARMTIPLILSSIQEKLMELYSLIFDLIDQKYGHIKSEILGGMINFSSRCVIIPDPELKADEIKLNYTAFLEIFKFEIIGCLTKMSDITENEAYNRWHAAKIEYNPQIYEVMNYILKKRKPKVLINRNPKVCGHPI